MKKILFVAVTTLGLIADMAFAETPLVQNSGVSFDNLTDGQQVTSPVHVKMVSTGKIIGPAGEVIEGVGHHHIIIDGSAIKTGEVIPMDEKHLHFGKGQMETDVILTAGKHTLTLQLADGAHRSYGEEWSKTITIEVK